MGSREPGKFPDPAWAKLVRVPASGIACPSKCRGPADPEIGFVLHKEFGMVQKQVTPRNGWGRRPQGDAPRSDSPCVHRGRAGQETTARTSFYQAEFARY